MSNRKTIAPVQTERPTCPDHEWCWGSCQFPNEDNPGEHRTPFRILEPAEQFGETRRGWQKSIATGMIQRGDAAPSIHLRIQTDRRSIEVSLTFLELNRLCGDLWHAAGILAQEQSKNDVLLRCPRCRVTYHPDALGGYGRPCRDCGGLVHEVGTRGHTARAERAVDKIHGGAWGAPKVECRDCAGAFDPDSSPHPDRCQSCAEKVDGLVDAR